jgi:hypothetical protein
MKNIISNFPFPEGEPGEEVFPDLKIHYHDQWVIDKGIC